MGSASADVEQIVQLVIERLRAAGGQPPALPASSAVAPATATGQRLTLSQRVVTLAALDGKLNGVRQLVVHANAVLTPSVQDELRERKIALVRDGASPTQPAALSGTLWVAGTSHARQQQAVCQKLAGLVACVRPLESQELVRLVDDLRRQLAVPTHLGLLLSEQPALAACLANRHGQLRAAVAQAAVDIDTARQTLGANLLILNPHTHSESKLLELACLFAQAGPAACPPCLAGGADRPALAAK